MSSATSNPHINHSSHSGSTTGTAHRSQPTTQACAACKYQRRKCNPDCTLAPYFPADHQRQFLNAHRLFGVSNILKIIRNLDPLQRSEAMRSIIFQSNARAHDPVGGCYRIILELQRQYERDSAELAIVLRQLAFYRAQAQTHGLPPDLDPAAIQSAPILNLDADDATYAANPQNLDPAMHQQQQQQQYYNYFYFDEGGDNNNNNNSSNSNSNSINNYNNNNNNNNSNVVEMEMTQSMLSLQQQCGVAADDDVKPLVDMFDDEVKPLLEFTMGNQEEDHKDAAAAAVSSTGGYHCSNRMELKEDANLMEHVQEHDLKGAASLFTLTNCHASSL